MDIEVIYNIGESVAIKGGDQTHTILGYEYIPPSVRYIILQNDGSWMYCVPSMLEKKETPKVIGFTMVTTTKTDEGKET